MAHATAQYDSTRRIVRRYGTSAAIILILLAAVLLSFQVLFDQKRLLDRESRVNVWFLAQTEIEFLRLEVALKDLQLGQPGVGKKEVLERMEIFWSRLPILLNGRQSAELRLVDGLKGTAEQAIDTLAALEPAFDALDPADPEGARALDERLGALRQPLHEIVLKALTFNTDLNSEERKGHERRYYQLVALFIAIIAGGTAFFLLFSRQVVRSRRAEAEANTAREQLVVAIDSVSEGFILYDAEDRAVLFNKRYLELHPGQAAFLKPGTSFGELLRRAAESGQVEIPDGDVDAWHARCLDAHRNPGAPFDSRLGNGTWIKISERRTADGRLVCIHTDITPLKRREAELTQKSHLLSAILGSIHQGIAVFDAEMRLTAWNARFLEFHGLPKEAVAAGLPHDALSGSYVDEGDPAEESKLAVTLRRAASSGGTRGRFERHLPSGAVIEVTFDPMPGGGLVKTYIDVTERVRAEAERTRILEEKVDERTRQLVNEIKEREAAQTQLAHSQRVESIGQLTGGVAHDFNNLLTTVIGSLDLLCRHVSSEHGKRLLKNATTAAERGASLTQRLLAFARKQRLEPRSVNVHLLVSDMRDLLARSLGPAVRITVDAAPDLRPALVDKSQLEMIVLNLAINARDAMPDGGNLTIWLENTKSGGDAPPELAPGDYVRLSLADTGTGMDRQTLARAFEPFYTTKEVGKGTGLGLSMVHGIAAQSGGAARIRSALGKGTTVEVWLPRAPAATVEERPNGGMAQPERGEGRILVCDDEPQVRDFVAESLRDWGYDVLEAADGRAALALMEREEIAALVVDFAMPDINGAVVAREARRRRPALPVLMITGHAELDRVDGDALPPILQKPFKPTEIAGRVADILREDRERSLCAT